MPLMADWSKTISLSRSRIAKWLMIVLLQFNQ
jgi:hypothetical protein